MWVSTMRPIPLFKIVSRLLAKFDWVSGHLQKIWFYSENYHQKLPFRDRPRLDAPLDTMGTLTWEVACLELKHE